MAHFVMLMMGAASKGDWGVYVETLIRSGAFRGGSSLGNGVAVSRGRSDSECSITGIIRLEVDELEQARRLLAGNPLYEAGGRVELLEEVPDEPARG